MLIKWVRCRVTGPSAFGRGQEGWGALADVPGFLGQWGGWSEPGVAHVVALWRSGDAHAAFLAGPHDRLAAAQAGTFDGIDVRLFDRELEMDGPRDGAVVRLAHCHVHAGREEHFVRAQSEVWTPGMTAAGMRGGVFGRNAAEFLVVSWWPSAQEHARYQADVFPGLRAASRAVDDLSAIAGALVVLEPSWAVPPAV
jgi:heme-degrading monooxygenase HmoA